MIHPTDIRLFIEHARGANSVVVDVRSPKEYAQGHVPGALNLPLLNDEERHIVGITFKEKNQHEAVKKGLQLVGHKFVEYVQRAEELAPQKHILIYCWRGGLRSNIMAWLLNLAGFEVELLTGGYKSYRHYCLEEFSRERKILILAGKTGAGKTDILKQLEAREEFVIDLEEMAHHKGSAFGGLGKPEQPTQEQFENVLGWKLGTANDRLTWVENESRFIGRLRVPDLFFEKMDVADILEVDRSMDQRADRILTEYGHFSIEMLREKTTGVTKRMGGDQVKMSVACLEEGDMKGWVMPLLAYYDKTYAHSLSERKGKTMAVIPIDDLENDQIAERLMAFLKSTTTKAMN